GAKAAQKRERNAKNAAAGPKSQLKTNAAAMNIICQTCRATFPVDIAREGVSKTPELLDHLRFPGHLHAQNKHNKTLADCFPGFVEQPRNKRALFMFRRTNDL
ncbi:At2g23090 like protein, partial [Neurospora crassa]